MRPTRRKDLPDLLTMKPKEFIGAISKIVMMCQGIVSQSTATITEKIDGCALRFGTNDRKQFFTESSYVGPIYNVGGFVETVSEKYEHANLFIPSKFDSILQDLLNSRIPSYLKSLGSVKVIGEILYHSLSHSQDATSTTFNYIPYTNHRLGKTMTLVIYDVHNNCGYRHEYAREILEELRSTYSNSDIRIVSPLIYYPEVSIEDEYLDLLQFLHQNDLYENIITSRKKIHREDKDRLLAKIDECRESIRTKLLAPVKSGILGDHFEGLVIEFKDDNVIKFKVTTDDFIALKRDFSA